MGQVGVLPGRPAHSVDRPRAAGFLRRCYLMETGIVKGTGSGLMAIALMMVSTGRASGAELKAGVARLDITPPLSMKATLGGYGDRMNKPATGVHDRVFAKALVLAHDQIPADDIVSKLREKKINVHRSRSSSTLLDATARSLPDLVRVSPHYYNADEEVERFIQSMKAILS